MINSYKSFSEKYYVDQDAMGSYLKGWVFQEDSLNDITYVFFGKNVKSTNSNIIEDIIKEISSTCYEVDGYFKFDNREENYSHSWEIVSGFIKEELVESCMCKLRTS